MALAGGGGGGGGAIINNVLKFRKVIKFWQIKKRRWNYLVILVYFPI